MHIMALRQDIHGLKRLYEERNRFQSMILPTKGILKESELILSSLYGQIKKKSLPVKMENQFNNPMMKQRNRPELDNNQSTNKICRLFLNVGFYFPIKKT